MIMIPFQFSYIIFNILIWFYFFKNK